MHIAPSLLTIQATLIGLALIGIAPTVVRWFIRQNKEIALQTNFLSLSHDEKEYLRKATLENALNKLVAVPTISTELRTLAATVTKRSDRVSLIQEWYATHLRNQEDRARRSLAN